MRTENIVTGEMVRIPRKLKKKVYRNLISIDGVSNFGGKTWLIFLVPVREWVRVKSYN